jgi:hypothetical protein
MLFLFGDVCQVSGKALGYVRLQVQLWKRQFLQRVFALHQRAARYITLVFNISPIRMSVDGAHDAWRHPAAVCEGSDGVSEAVQGFRARGDATRVPQMGAIEPPSHGSTWPIPTPCQSWKQMFRARGGTC